MKRRVFFGGALAGMSLTGAYAAPPKLKEGDIPTTTFGRTGEKVSVIAQGGARMDLQPDVQTAAAFIRRVYDLGVTFFDCSRMYWRGQAEDVGVGGVIVRACVGEDELGRTGDGCIRVQFDRNHVCRRQRTRPATGG